MATVEVLGSADRQKVRLGAFEMVRLDYVAVLCTLILLNSVGELHVEASVDIKHNKGSKKLIFRLNKIDLGPAKQETAIQKPCKR